MSNFDIIEPVPSILLLQNANCGASHTAILDTQTIECFNNWNEINIRDSTCIPTSESPPHDLCDHTRVFYTSKIKVGDKFDSFESLKKAVLDAFPYQGIRLKQKQYRKSGERAGLPCRWTFVCKCAGSAKTKSPGAKSRKSIKSGCKWHVSAWWPESQDGPHISKMETIHTGHSVLTEHDLKRYVFGDDVKGRAQEIEVFLLECLQRSEKVNVATESVRSTFFPSKDLSNEACHAIHTIYSRLRKHRDRCEGVDSPLRSSTARSAVVHVLPGLSQQSLSLPPGLGLGLNLNLALSGSEHSVGHGGHHQALSLDELGLMGPPVGPGNPLHALLDACLPPLAQFTERLNGSGVNQQPIMTMNASSELSGLGYAGHSYSAAQPSHHPSDAAPSAQSDPSSGNLSRPLQHRLPVTTRSLPTPPETCGSSPNADGAGNLRVGVVTGTVHGEARGRGSAAAVTAGRRQGIPPEPPQTASARVEDDAMDGNVAMV